jgi:hypothetical protein
MSTASPSDTQTTPEAPTERCGQCGAPAAREQRYCVNCGFHRRNAPDPVARYLSEASAARTRVLAATALAAQRRRAPRIGIRLVVALVVSAVLVGLLIGSSLNGSSARLHIGSTNGSARSQTSTTSGNPSRSTTKIKNATGSSYLQQEQDLPNTVTP